MKKKIFFISIFLFLVILFMGTQVKATNVLFVGNSKTYYNDFPTMFKNIANTANSNNKVYVKSVTQRRKKFRIFVFVENSKNCDKRKKI